MLPLALVVATLLASPKPAQPSPLHVACPATPAAYTVVPAARSCAALEVTGSIDASTATIDPAFNVDVAPAQLAHPERGEAVLAGYAADGHTIFVQTLNATGAFHLFIPLSPALAAGVQRLQVVSGTQSAEIVATSHKEPIAETLALDANHYLVAWNARQFPSIRVSAPNAVPLLLSGGTSTYEQRTIDSTARAIVLEFSDGVRSTSRPYRIFGR
ncbi:MAG: hypothetical protein IAI50_14485 [Candidatus Eremiobacteraeota bacterium]|nr:hypothetical protein [Candidatus Eremiobacteraeota bacterium]